MTIHHDKLAYGRLKSLNDELSSDEIADLVEALNAEEDEDENKETAAENAEENKDIKDKT